MLETQQYSHHGGDGDEDDGVQFLPHTHSEKKHGEQQDGGQVEQGQKVSAGLEAWKVQQSYLEDAEAGGRNQSGYGGAQSIESIVYQLVFLKFLQKIGYVYNDVVGWNNQTDGSNKSSQKSAKESTGLMAAVITGIGGHIYTQRAWGRFGNSNHI